MFSLITPSLILVAGLIDDLKTQKVHNKLVLACIAVAIVSTLVIGGFEQLKMGVLAAGTAIVITLPFVLIKALGAGDLKLLFAFGLASNPTDVFYVFLYSLVWGALLGLFRALLSKEGRNLFINIYLILKGLKPEAMQTHKFPYTVALLFGWLTQIYLNFGVYQ